MVLCSHFEYPICDSVHSYFISPCQTPFETWAFSSKDEAMDCLRTNKNCVHTGTRCPLLCLTTRWRPCGRAPAPCPSSSVGTWRKGVFTLVPSEYRTRAPCPGTKCERCPYFASLLLKRSDTVVETAQRKVRGKITVKNFSFLFFFWRSGTKQTVLTVPLLFFLFRRALSSCCLQQTCPCKHPVSMFILVCNISLWR